MCLIRLDFNSFKVQNNTGSLDTDFAKNYMWSFC